MVIKLKRAYEAVTPSAGFRILVDRLSPQGVSKHSARIDLWLKEIAPTTALWKWFGHDPARWAGFRNRYFRQLDKNRDAVEQLLGHVRHGTVTLVYGAKDEKHNDTVAFKDRNLKPVWQSLSMCGCVGRVSDRSAQSLIGAPSQQAKAGAILDRGSEAHLC